MVQLLTILLVVCITCLAQGDRRLEPVEERRAFLVGNDRYDSPLRNAVNDARGMQRVLDSMGFQTQLETDASGVAFETRFVEFLKSVRPGSVVLFYFAGHGVQVEGENYLIPVDFKGTSEADVKFRSHAASWVQEKLESTNARLKVLILDACRSNPFRATRAGSMGLAQMSAGRGSFIAFATGPGRVAEDGSGSNGLFTKHLISALGVEGLSLNDLFDRVRTGVDAESKGKQIPWVSSSVIGSFYFRRGARPEGPTESSEAEYWRVIANSEDEQLVSAFLNKFPNGVFAEAAKKRRADLAEARQRRQAEARQAEEDRLASAKQAENERKNKMRVAELAAETKAGYHTSLGDDHRARMERLQAARALPRSTIEAAGGVADDRLDVLIREEADHVVASFRFSRPISETAFEDWMRLVPNDPRPHAYLAVSLLMAKRQDEAVAEAAKAVNMAQSNPGESSRYSELATKVRGRILLACGRYAELVGWLGEKQLEESDESAIQVAFAIAATGNPTKAADFFDRITSGYAIGARFGSEPIGPLVSYYWVTSQLLAYNPSAPFPKGYGSALERTGRDLAVQGIEASLFDIYRKAKSYHRAVHYRPKTLTGEERKTLAGETVQAGDVAATMKSLNWMIRSCATSMLASLDRITYMTGRGTANTSECIELLELRAALNEAQGKPKDAEKDRAEAARRRAKL